MITKSKEKSSYVTMPGNHFSSLDNRTHNTHNFAFTNSTSQEEIDDEKINFSYQNKNEIFLGDLVGRVPKYSRPFPQKYLEKVRHDYNEWVEIRQRKEYQQMMSDAERIENRIERKERGINESTLNNVPTNFDENTTTNSKGNDSINDNSINDNSSNDNSSNAFIRSINFSQSLPSTATGSKKDSNAITGFDPCTARAIISEENKKNRYLTSRIKFISPISVPYHTNDTSKMLHKNKRFHVGAIDQRDDGSIRIFDEALKVRKEMHDEKMKKRILKYDKLDIKKQKKKTHMLYDKAKEQRDSRKLETLNLGISCQQQWAIMRSPESNEEPTPTPPRPITASSKQAMDELAEFDERQNQKAKIEKRKKMNAFSEFGNDDQFKLTQLPPGAAILKKKEIIPFEE